LKTPPEYENQLLASTQTETGETLAKAFN